MNDKTPQWVVDLKPGDKVANRTYSPWSAPYLTLTFVRATATQLVLNSNGHEVRANRQEARLIGKRQAAGLEPYTGKVAEAVEHYKLAQRIAALVAADLKQVPLIALRAMVAILDEAKTS